MLGRSASFVAALRARPRTTQRASERGQAVECFVLRQASSRRRFQRAVKRRSIGVSVRASLHALGRVLEVASLTLALPALVAAAYLESPLPFLVPLAIGLAIGFLLERT